MQQNSYQNFRWFLYRNVKNDSNINVLEYSRELQTSQNSQNNLEKQGQRRRSQTFWFQNLPKNNGNQDSLVQDRHIGQQPQ